VVLLAAPGAVTDEQRAEGRVFPRREQETGELQSVAGEDETAWREGGPGHVPIIPVR
jgi:hypothetical protein